jgi:monothiol glutaredoxin
MALDEALKSRIEQTIKKGRVVLFMKGNKSFPQCGFSASVVGILKEIDVPFETVNILADQELRDGLKIYSEWPTFPQLYVDGELVGGADIVREMHGKGELAKLLGAEVKEPEPPQVTITEGAVMAFRGAAAEAEAGETLRLAIDAAFANDLYFGPKQQGDIVITANGITLAMDAATAKRAAGLVIDFVQGPDGAGFKLTNPYEPPRVRPIRAEDVKRAMDKGEKLVLVDVRTEKERDLAVIAGTRLYDPTYDAELAQLPKDTKLVFHCHHGMRSQQAAQRFVDRGFSNVWNLSGGIDAWSAIDPSIPRY